MRFDPVYVVYFKTNVKRIADYPNLVGFVRDAYQSVEPVRRATNIKHIKMHYYTSHPALNTRGIIPASMGPDLEAEHGRARPTGFTSRSCQLCLCLISILRASGPTPRSKRKGPNT